MRQLVESRSVIVVLIGLYLCASLAAIPVPRYVADAFRPVETGVACKCGEASACALSDSCCCAAKAHAASAEASADDEGPSVLTFGCTPQLKWFLAAIPVFAGNSTASFMLDDNRGERLLACDTDVVSSRWLDVQSPPPKRTI